MTISPLKAVEFVVYLAILQQIEGNVIYPRVVGGSIGLPGIWVLAAVSVGGGLLGIPGMLIGVPLTADGSTNGSGMDVSTKLQAEAEQHRPGKKKNSHKYCSLPKIRLY